MHVFNLEEYQNNFQQKIYKEVDELFPINKSKERDKALLLITTVVVEFKEVLKKISNEKNMAQTNGKKESDTKE